MNKNRFNKVIKYFLETKAFKQIMLQKLKLKLYLLVNGVATLFMIINVSRGMKFTKLF